LNYLARLSASFPYLWTVNAVDENGNHPYSFTEKEFMDNRSEWEDDMETDPLWSNINQIAASSAKLNKIKEIIETCPLKVDGYGNSPRFVFCSWFLTGARIIYFVSL
jgi:hypothetical protein